MFDANTGTPLNSGILANEDTNDKIDIEESGDYVIPFFHTTGSTLIFLIVIPKGSFDINEAKEYTMSGASQNCFIALDHNSLSYLYYGVVISENYSPARSLVTDLRNFDFFVERPTIFSEITTVLAIEDPVSTPALSYTSVSASSASPPAIFVTPHSVTPGAVEYYAHIDDSDFIGTYNSSTSVSEVIDFGCLHSSNPDFFIFTVETLNSEPIPTWVTFDDVQESLTLSQTPTVTVRTEFQFQIRIDYGVETFYKKFFITISPPEETSESSGISVF